MFLVVLTCTQLACSASDDQRDIGKVSMANADEVLRTLFLVETKFTEEEFVARVAQVRCKNGERARVTKQRDEVGVGYTVEADKWRLRFWFFEGKLLWARQRGGPDLSFGRKKH
jgi:hypothetical protein